MKKRGRNTARERAAAQALAGQSSQHAPPQSSNTPATPIRRATVATPSTSARSQDPPLFRHSSGSGLTPKAVDVHRTKTSHTARTPIRAQVGIGTGVRGDDRRKPLPTQIGFSLGIHTLRPPSPVIEDPVAAADGPENEDPIPDPAAAQREERRIAYGRKRALTVARWRDDVIPRLRAPMMRLLEETDNLRLPPRRSSPMATDCTCGGKYARELTVCIVRQTSVQNMQIHSCKCRPAAVQLVEIGLFPCAPYRPTLAVDINVLDFVRTLFFNISPNVTAWCKTMEAFLMARGHKLAYSDNLRKRFGYALLWYGHLRDTINAHVDAVVGAARRTQDVDRLAPDAEDDDTGSFPSSPTQLSYPAVASDSDESSGDELPQVSAVPDPPSPSPLSELAAPSEYLRSRCPACFGSPRRLSLTEATAPDCVVALDACFSQKHNAQRRDPVFVHTRPIMLSETKVADAADRWEAAHERDEEPPRKRRGQGATTPDRDDARYMAEGIRVPAQSLRHCEESFTAAQSYVAKASVGHHDVTAAMALICRHDIPLFWANMTTAGEKQFYVLALLDAFVDELPSGWTIGFLYDIACQIHLSAVKYGIFDRYIHRMQFAVSVFHAFGHDWPCQLIYHPRKRIGFGLSDGEGCERFWYSLSRLISYLRVAGYHLRLYTLNAQIAFNTREAVYHLGSWFSRKATLLNAKRGEANELLREAGTVAQDRQYVDRQWNLQVEEQTKPTPRQGKKTGRKEVEAALELLTEVTDLQTKVQALEASAVAGAASEESLADLEAARAAHHSAQVRYQRKKAQLGVPLRARLDKLLDDAVLHLRANNIVLLRRIQRSIMRRKLELERVVRAHRNKTSERQLQKHTKTAVERRDASVKSLVAKYNKACQELDKAIKDRRRQRGLCTIRPLKPLPPQGLWSLDVDDVCWDDLRFDMDGEGEPPAWMTDDDLRKAIRGHLLLDRCAEEERRLAHERENSVIWFEEEWQALRLAARSAVGVPDAPALRHQLAQRRRWFLRMAAEWERRGLSVRGPSDSEVAAALAEWASPSFESDAADAQEVEDDEVGPGVGVESEESGDEGEALNVDVADLEDVVEAGEEAL